MRRFINTRLPNYGLSYSQRGRQGTANRYCFGDFMTKPILKNITLGIAATVLMVPGSLIGILLGEIFSFFQNLFIGNSDGIYKFTSAYVPSVLGGLVCGFCISVLFKRWIDIKYPKTFFVTASILPLVSILGSAVLPFISNSEFNVSGLLNAVTIIVGLFYGLKEEGLFN